MVESDIENKFADLSASNPTELVNALVNLIEEGQLAPTQRLPPVRRVAQILSISPTSVAVAWRTLTGMGLIRGAGRHGTFVASPHRPLRPTRWMPQPHRTIDGFIDLSSGFPDRGLLPKLSTRHLVGLDDLGAYSYLDNPVLEGLELEIRATVGCGFEKQKLLITDGAMDAIDRALGILIRSGDLVAIEDPGFPAIFDLIEVNGGRLHPVSTDENGVTVESLGRAIDKGAKVLICQPRSLNPTGDSRNSTRNRELAELISGTGSPMVIIEDDHSALISQRELHSLTTYLPDRTLYVVSFSKSHGPDLRIGALMGPGNVIDEIQQRRRLGPAWTSKALQQLLLNLLRDTETTATVSRARETYAKRRSALLQHLQSAGYQPQIGKGDGLNMWLAVPDEQRTLIALAAGGLSVAQGSGFRINPSADHNIRLTLSMTDDQIEHIGSLLVACTINESVSWRM